MRSCLGDIRCKFDERVSALRHTRMVLEGIDSVCLLQFLFSGCGGNLKRISAGALRDLEIVWGDIRPGYRSILFP